MYQNLNMVKVVCHLADIHIRTYRLHDEYREVFNNLFIQLNELLKDYKRDEIRIVIAGDLVHQKIIISNEQMILCSWLLKNLEKIAPVVLIAGNHDLLENNKDRVDSITPIVHLLEDLNINYFKESNCYLDDDIVWCVYSIFEENKRPDIESARLQFGSDKTYIGLYHGPLIGAKTDLGYVIEHGATLEIFAGCDMVMLGDIHKRSSFIYNDGGKNIPINYPSSLLQQNFGENVSNHGFLLWNLERRIYTEHDVKNDNPLYVFKIRSSNDISYNKEILINL